MTEMVFGADPVRGGEPVIPRWWRTVDKWSLSGALLLFGIGILLGLAASPPLAERNGVGAFHYAQRQALFGGLAIFAMAVAAMMSPKLLRRLGVLSFLCAFAALALLPAFGTDFGKGSVRWYSLGFGSVQPSEFLKPGFVVVVAWLMTAGREPGGRTGTAVSFLIAAVVTALLAIQPDFGQACLVLFVWGVMHFVAGAAVAVLVALAALVVGAGSILYGSSEHFARRIDGFLSPEVDPTTQLGHAANAIREGGFFGVGVGEGQVKWFLPDAHTDFVIAVAAEEYGLILVLLIIALYAMITIRSLLRLTRESDSFVRLAGTGLAATFGVQAAVNMGVAVRLVPAKGMVLPFISYGGSSLIAGAISVGMLLAFTRNRLQGEIVDLLPQRGR